MQANWCSVQRMVWARTGWPPHPFNLCSNAGSTHNSISQTQPLDMTLSTCTQLLWSTMERPVLSGTCPVKPLYGHGHRAAAQFQVLGNLLIAYAILCSAAVLNSSPSAPAHRCIFCMSLFVTHLIQIIYSLEMRSVHELCSDWHCPYSVHCSLLPEQGNPLKFTSLRNIHSWICAAQHLHTRTSVR